MAKFPFLSRPGRSIALVLVLSCPAQARLGMLSLPLKSFHWCTYCMVLLANVRNDDYYWFLFWSGKECCRVQVGKKVVHDCWICRRNLIVGIACTRGLCIRGELIFLDKCVIWENCYNLSWQVEHELGILQDGRASRAGVRWELVLARPLPKPIDPHEQFTLSPQWTWRQWWWK